MQNTFNRGLDLFLWIAVIMFILTSMHHSAETKKSIEFDKSKLVEETTQVKKALRNSIQILLQNQNQLNDQVSRLIEHHQAKAILDDQDRTDINDPKSDAPDNASYEGDIPFESELENSEERLNTYSDSELKDLKLGIYEEKLLRFESSLKDKDLEELELRTQLLLDQFLNEALSSNNPLLEGVSLDFLKKDESSLLPKEKFARNQIIESMRKSALVEMHTEEEIRKKFQRIDEMELELQEQELDDF